MEREKQDSGDVPSGYVSVSIPKKFPLAAVIAAGAVLVGLLFSAGGWAWALQDTQNQHTRRLDSIDKRWSIVQSYMCMECSRRAQESGHDCRFICGMETDQ